MSTELETYEDQIAKLYIVFFGRAPDAEGMNHWLPFLIHGAATLNDLADEFAISAEARKMYGDLSLVTYGDGPAIPVIRHFYENALDREPDADGLAFWLNKLREGHSFAEIAVAKIETAFGGGDTVHPNDTAIVRNKVEVAKYVSVTLASNEPDVVDSAFDNVTADPASVNAAKARLSAQAAELAGRVIEGDDQAQTLTGGPGHDTITGGAGDDTLIGEAGADFLTGGQGRDVFVYTSGATGQKLSTADVITDFEPGIDKIKTNLPDLSWTEVLIEDATRANIFSYSDFVSRAIEAFGNGSPVYVASNPAYVGDTWVAINNGSPPIPDSSSISFSEGDSLVVLQGIEHNSLLSGTDFIA